jgi:hypothetical protein
MIGMVNKVIAAFDDRAERYAKERDDALKVRNYQAAAIYDYLYDGIEIAKQIVMKEVGCE